MKYTVKVSYYHNIEVQPWYIDVEGDEYNDALVNAFKEAFDIECGVYIHEDVIKEALMNNKNIEADENNPEVEIFKDNKGFRVDEYNGKAIFINVEERQDTQKSLANAIKAYDYKFDKLPIEVLKNFLEELDSLE